MGVTFVMGGGKDPLGPHSGPHLDCRAVLGIRPWPNKRREQPSGSAPGAEVWEPLPAAAASCGVPTADGTRRALWDPGVQRSAVP